MTKEKTSSTTLQRQSQTANAFAVLTTLFAGVQAQLLSGFSDETSSKISQGLMNALQFFSYGGLAINISASLAAILFISFANMILAEWDDVQEDSSSQQDVPIKLEYLLDQAAKLRYVFLGLTFLGTYFVLLQISVLTWTTCNRPMFWLVIVVVWFSFVPLTMYAKLMVLRRQRHK